MPSLRDFIDLNMEYRQAKECSEQLITCGKFDSELDAADYFDSLVNPNDWTVYKEVVGKSYCPNIYSNSSGNARIDRVLVPTRQLMDTWKNGPIGVEIKKSREPIGKPVAQILDYLNCVFELPNQHYCNLKNIFLFPFLGFPCGALGSLLAQKRVGFASHVFFGNQPPSLRFYLGGGCVYSQGEGARNDSRQRSGQKFGSR